MSVRRLITIAFSLAAGALPVAGQDGAHWEWTVAPSVLAPSLSGSFYISGENFLGQLADPNNGGTLYVEGRQGEWAFVLDGLYLSLNQPVVSDCCSPGGGGAIDSGGTQGTQWSVQALALRRVVKSLELAFGVAGNRLQASVNVHGMTGGGPPPVPFAISASQTELWAMGVLGARWTPVDAAHWRATLFGELGYGSADNKMWQVLPSVGYRIGPVVEVAAQYRVMHTVYSAGATWFGYDVRMSSPALAVAMRF